MSRRVSVVGRQDLRKEIELVGRYYAIMGRAMQFLGGRDCRTRFGDSNAELPAARSLESQRSETKNVAS